jgi:hypothetical protein
VADEVVRCCSLFTFNVDFVWSNCMFRHLRLSHAGSCVRLSHWLSPGPALCIRTLGDRGGLACAEFFGLVPSAGEVGLPVAAPLLVDCARAWRPLSGSLSWCFAACEGPLVGLPCRGHFGFSCCWSFFRLSRACWLSPFWVAFGSFAPFTVGCPFCVGFPSQRCNFLFSKKKKK